MKEQQWEDIYGFFFIQILTALALSWMECEKSSSKLVLGMEKFILTSPEQQAGVCLHGAAWTAQGPFCGEGEGTMTL